MSGEARGRQPAMPGVQIADMAGGGLWGATTVLGAIVQRDRTGAGAHIDLSMTEGAMALLIAELGNLDCGARPTRGAETLYGALACYGVYRCRDDRYLSVGALEPKFYLAFNQAIGRAGSIAEIAGDAKVQDKVRGEIAAILATRTRDEWLPILAQHDCCCEPVLELDELADHPQHVARGVFFSIDGGAAGPITQLRTPVGAPAKPTAPPKLGEHSRAVLADYGFSADDIASLVTG